MDKNKRYHITRIPQTNEKLWFVNQVDLESYDLIVDYGCIDGTIFTEIEDYTSADLLGYNAERSDRSYITTNWNYVLDEIISHRKTLVIFSDVLHCTWRADIMNVLDDLILRGVDTIVIRDMIDKIRSDRDVTPQQLVGRIENNFEIQPQHIDTYLHKPSYSNIAQFLLKYYYTDDDTIIIADNGVDYFSTPWESIKNKLVDAYFVPFDFVYVSNCTRRHVLNDFGFDIGEFMEGTHKAIIYKKRRYKNYE